MDYNNNNYNNDNYNNSTYDGNNDFKTNDSRDSANIYDNNYYSQNADNPYEQSGANMEQNINQTAGGRSPYISSEYSSTYGQNNYQTSYSTTDTTEKEEPVSVLDWVGTLLLTMVPCAALIVYLIWAFGSNTKKSKSNFCKAYLIVMLISTVLVIILYILIFAFAFAAGEFY